MKRYVFGCRGETPETGDLRVEDYAPFHDPIRRRERYARWKAKNGTACAFQVYRGRLRDFRGTSGRTCGARTVPPEMHEILDNADRDVEQAHRRLREALRTQQMVRDMAFARGTPVSASEITDGPPDAALSIVRGTST